MQPKIRLNGIDLLRCIAILAVIILHADEGISTHPQLWTKILEFSGFAVPFFLATSFYLTFNKIYKTQGQYSLAQRLKRLLIPYLFWTGVYVGYKLFKYVLQNEIGNISKLFQDPVALIFFGSAAFQLYFLPLLASGTIIVKPISSLVKKQINIKYLALLSILSLGLYQTLILSGNSFEIRSSIAFQDLLNNPYFFQFQDNQILRIFLVAIAMIVRCLPYIFIAMFLSHPQIQKKILQKQSILLTTLLTIMFLTVNTFGSSLLPQAIHELSRGYLALLLGIQASNYLKPNKLINNLSICSFGIYLIHLLFVETFQILESRIYPGGMFRVSTPNLLIFALLTLAFSWIATDILMGKKSLARLMFGM
ncbi:MAG: acyltransferase [Nostocaceae cyanobacterium]|nr:acyltransferase [Nostocaceae cyanobacterium]